MGAGLSKEHRFLPLAVTTLSPEQRRRLPAPSSSPALHPHHHQHHHHPLHGDAAAAAPADQLQAGLAAALPGPEQPAVAVRGSVSPVAAAPPARSPPPTAPQQQQPQQPQHQEQAEDSSVATGQQPQVQQLVVQPRQSHGSRLSRLLPNRKQRVITLDIFDEDSSWWDPDLADESVRASPVDGRDFADSHPDHAASASPRSAAAPNSPVDDRSPNASARHRRPANPGETAAAAPSRSNAGIVIPLAGPAGRRKSRKLYPYAFSELQSTVDIALCSLGILKLSPHIGVLQSAVSIQLCCNSLTSLPPSFTNLKGLTHLDVSHNNLLHLPLNIGDLSKLVELRLADNSLVSLPPSIRQLSRLQLLSVARNELKSLPAEIGALERLVELDIAGNVAVRYLPAEIGKLKNLKHVRVRGCGLARELPVSTAAGAPRTGGDVPRDPQTRMPSLKELCARALLRWYPELQDVAAGAPARPAYRPPVRWSSPLSSPHAGHHGHGADGAAPVDGIAHSHSSKSLSTLASLGMRTSTSRSSLSSLSSDAAAASSSMGSSASSATGSPPDSPHRNHRWRKAAGEKGSKVLAPHHALASAVLEKAPHLPRNLLAYLSSAHRCSFCGGPYLDWYVARYRFIDRKSAESDDPGAEGGGGGGGRDNNRLPLEYRLCSNHWETESERLQAMFAPMPATAASAWYNPRLTAAGGDHHHQRSPGGLRRPVSSFFFGG